MKTPHHLNSRKHKSYFHQYCIQKIIHLCHDFVVENHPLHGLTSRAVIGLGSKQRVVIVAEILIAQHRGLNSCQLFPRGLVEQVAFVYLADHSDEIDV